MTVITRQQRKAVKRIYDRCALYAVPNHPDAPLEHDPQEMGQEPATYRTFRRTVKTELYGDGIMIHWCNMWLGIESDGYTHS